ncbi:excalibur calcium-binding domain-containing protein [Streptomyces sp. NPDC002324]
MDRLPRAAGNLHRSDGAEPPDSPAPDTPASPDLPEGPPAGVPDVVCSDLSGPVWVGPDVPHRLDRDGDGIGCEAVSGRLTVLPTS